MRPPKKRERWFLPNREVSLQFPRESQCEADGAAFGKRQRARRLHPEVMDWPYSSRERHLAANLQRSG